MGKEHVAFNRFVDVSQVIREWCASQTKRQTAYLEHLQANLVSLAY